MLSEMRWLNLVTIALLNWLGPVIHLDNNRYGVGFVVAFSADLACFLVAICEGGGRYFLWQQFCL